MKTWKETQKILVILAHPDDPEFFCGATLAKWISEGHQISYLLLTRGEKGINEHFNLPNVEDIIRIRKNEQEKAARVLGIQNILYLQEPDGYLVPSLSIRRKVVKAIREVKPNIVVTCDPTNYYMRDTYINHPDHRAAGQIVIDSVFPAVQNPAFYPDLMIKDKLYPHKIREIWLSLPFKPNSKIDVTKYWSKKLEALHAHESQIGEPVEFDLRMLNRRVKGSSPKKPKFEEVFHRIILQN
jgi:LmbE family N-acetylglucosaminyl deacetylase